MHIANRCAPWKNSQSGASHPPLTFLHGQIKSESEMFPVGFGVEYLSGKLLPLTLESWEFVWLVSQSAVSSVHWLRRAGCVFSDAVRCRVDAVD
jgi:hypothetical protein